jgi:hypothetical protein
MVINAFSEKE